jgi:cytochrome c oxidase subunit 1
MPSGSFPFSFRAALSGPFLAQPVLDIQLHDTYFVVGHFHMIMGVAAIFGMFAAPITGSRRCSGA